MTAKMPHSELVGVVVGFGARVVHLELHTDRDPRYATTVCRQALFVRWRSDVDDPDWNPIGRPLCRGCMLSAKTRAALRIMVERGDAVPISNRTADGYVADIVAGALAERGAAEIAAHTDGGYRVRVTPIGVDLLHILDAFEELSMVYD